MLLFLALSVTQATACENGELIYLATAGNNCTIRDNCFEIVGFGATNYATSENCSVEVCKEVTYEIQGFSIEDSVNCANDRLEIGEGAYCGYKQTPSDVDDNWTLRPSSSLGTTPPSLTGSLQTGQRITFQSDDSDEYQGTRVSRRLDFFDVPWLTFFIQVCVAAVPSTKENEVSTSDKEEEDPARSPGAIVGYVAAGIVVFGGVFYFLGHKQGQEAAQGNSLVGNLVF